MTDLSAVIGEEIFLTDKYLDLGLNSSGTLGTRASAPTGFVTDAANGYIRLGMLGDVDGFGAGKAATRDAMLAGTPIEGFSLGYDIGAKHYVNTNKERSGTVDITGGDTSNRSDTKALRAGWVGTTDENVKVDQTISLTKDARYVRVDITLTNLSGAALDNLRYMRTIDPDHGPNFNTNNQVVEQGGDRVGGALVAAYASGTTMPFFYYTEDERARVSVYGFDNKDPYADGVTSGAQAKGYGANGDSAVNINFALGSLKAGGSTTITFYMGITNDLDATIDAINAATDEPPPPPTNHAPEAVADKFSLLEGATVTGNVLANDKDADGDALHATLKTGPAHGTLTLADDGTFEYTPDDGYVGADSFSYTVSDGEASDLGTAKVTIQAVPNHAPTAVADSATVVSGSSVTGNVLANDKDADGDTLSAALKSGPTHGTVKLTGDGAFKYTPDAGYVGSDSFTYTVSDGEASAVGTATITVQTPPNRAPTAVADSASVISGASVTGNVLTNDKDPDGDALSAALKSGPKHGTLTLADDGAFKYTADAGYAGADSFTYTVSDGQSSDIGTATITIQVSPINHAPTAVADSASVISGSNVTGNVLTNDKDADGDALSATLKAGPSHGTLTFADDGAFKYTPDDGYVGPDSFTYTVSDGEASAVGTATIAVQPVPNRAPTAVGDSASVISGSSVTGNVLTNDKDLDGDALSAVLKAGPKHGTVTLGDDGAFKYTADAGFVGSDSFTYTVSDGEASAVGTATIAVQPAPNRAPTAVADSARVISGSSVTGNVLANDKDADGDALSATLKSGPAHGTVKLGDDGAFKYTPDDGYVGSDSFTYTVSDGEASAVGTATIAVQPAPNRAPTAVADSASVVSGASVTGNVLANDKDLDGDALSATLKTGPNHGTVTLGDDGAFKYTAEAGFVGSDSFTYTVSDGEASAVGTATIAVQPVPNRAPTAVADSASVVSGASVTGNVLTNDKDLDGDALSATLKSGPAHGTVKLGDDGAFKYTPDAGYVGSDSFTYTVSDGEASAVGTATIAVQPLPNRAPTAVADSASVVSGSSVTGNVLTNDKDPDGDTLSATLKTGPAHGTVALDDDGAFRYTPDDGYVGSDSFTYTVSDGEASAVGTATIAVQPLPNRAPTAVADSASVVSGSSVTGNVLTNDKDLDGDALSATLKSGPAHGTVKLGDDGAFKYTPDDGYVGSDSFTYTVSDGEASAVGTATIAVQPIPNRAPTAVADSARVISGSNVTGNVLTNDKDPDGDTLSATLKTGPAHGTVALDDDGAFRYTPDDGYVGSDSFTYTVSDGEASAVGTATIAVQPLPNRAPTAVADSASVVSGSSVTGNVLANDKDLDGDALSATLKSGPAHGTVKLGDDGAFKYTPDDGYVGSDSFTYTVSDGEASAVGTATIAVQPVPNRAPTAVADSARVITGSSVTGNVLTNDKDPDGDTLSALLKTGPKHGTVALADNGAFEYTPDDGYVGPDSFTYTVSDGEASAVGAAAISVLTPSNRAPTVAGDFVSVITGSSVTGNVLANDKDADGDALSAVLKTRPTHGTVTLADDGAFEYTPDDGYVGSDSFIYMVKDGEASASGMAIIAVQTTPNRAPTAVADSASVIAGSDVTGNVLANDKDADGDALSATLKSGPAHGTVTLGDDGAYKYTPDDGFVGSDSFTYTVSDGEAFAIGTATIAVQAPPNNHAPSAVADSASVVAGSSVTGNVLTNDKDVDGDTLSAVLETGPEHGTVTLADNGTFKYTPNAGYWGSDSFSYVAHDGTAASAVATVELTVKPRADQGPSNEVFYATTGHDVFYFDIDGDTGSDIILGFQGDDLLVTGAAIYDGNNDGLIRLKNSQLNLDGPGGGDKLTIDGVNGLRLLGITPDGASVYGDASVRPKGAIEGKLANDVMHGDLLDLRSQVFFFDNDLGLDLGKDRITRFGDNDVIVTTAALATDALGRVSLTARGTLELTGAGASLDAGEVTLTSLLGQAVRTLEFDGSVERGGVSYFVYSTVDPGGHAATLSFAS